MHRFPRSLALSLLVFIGFLSLTAAGLYAYANQSKLPSGLSISGWKAGGLTLPAFQQELASRLARQLEQKVALRSPSAEAAERELTLRQLGAVVRKEPLEAVLRDLYQADMVTRIRTRWTLRHAELHLQTGIDAAVLEQAVQEHWQALYAQQPVPAQRRIQADDIVSYEPEKSPLRINTAELRMLLEAAIPALNSIPEPAAPLQVELPLYRETPQVTLGKLKQEGVERKIAEFTTSFPPSGEGRLHNIRSTAASIQDMLLKPGDTFDYSKIIAKTESQFGFKEAPVILNGKLVPGVGGGICQVSSTLYNAVLRSGLEIVERRNHSLPVSYVPLGQDATYANGYINFKFRNTTSAYLLIRTVTTDRQVTVKLFGRMPASVSYDVESVIVETLTPPVKYVHNPSLRRGSTQRLSQGKAGYVVETYRIRKENGVQISRELISKDRYAPVPTLMAANNGAAAPHPAGEQEPGKPLLEDGVKGPTFR